MILSALAAKVQLLIYIESFIGWDDESQNPPHPALLVKPDLIIFLYWKQ